MSALTESSSAPSVIPGTLPIPRRSTPSQIAARSPISPDGVFDIMSLPKVYARAAGIGLRSPPLSADKETFGGMAGPAAGSASSSTGGSLASMGASGIQGGKGSYGPSVPSSGSGGKIGCGSSAGSRVGGADRKGKGRAIEASDPFVRPTPFGGSAPTSPDPASGFSPVSGATAHASPTMRCYAPPKKPLSPRQLSRIAQSFGIAIPSSPHTASAVESHPADGQTASPIASSSRVKLDATNYGSRPSPYLITIIPPASLLPTDTNNEAERRRWKRGRLVPLQPTYAGMMAAIAREFGLPGIVGLSIYLRDDASSDVGAASGRMRSMESALERFEDGESDGSGSGSGPMVTASTWGALFGQYAILANPATRGCSPAGTPRGFRLKHDLDSNTSLPALAGTTSTGSPYRKARPPDGRTDLMTNSDPHSRSRLHSLQGVSDHHNPSGPSPVAAVNQTTSISMSSDTSSDTSLPTPPYARSLSSSIHTQPQSAIIATLDLEVDEGAAVGWMGEWKRRCEQTRISGRGVSPASAFGLGTNSDSSPGGVRALRLPVKVRDEEALSSSPRFLRDRSAAAQAASGVGGILQGIPTIHVHARDASVSSPIMPNTQGYGGLTPNADLLASPINLGLSPDMALAQSPGLGQGGAGGLGGLTKSMLLTDEEREMLQRELAKRGSALVMSDQLDDLEKMMRQLSPRNISMTSPRQMTPNTAARIASSDLPMPSMDALSGLQDVRKKTISSSSTATSSTTTSVPGRHGSLEHQGPHAAWAITANKSAASVNTLATTASALSSVPSFDATTLSRPPMEAAFEEYQEEEITSPRLRKPSGGLGPGRGVTGLSSNVSSGEYFRPANSAKGIDEEQGEGRYRKTREQARELEKEKKRESEPASPGVRGSGRGFLGRNRSKSKSKGKGGGESVPFPNMAPSPAAASGRPDGDVPTSASGPGQTERASWKPSRPQRPVSPPDFDDPAWSATLSSPEFAFSPEMAQKIQATNATSSPHTPGPFSPFSLSTEGDAHDTATAVLQPPRTPLTPATDNSNSADHHTPPPGDAGERKKPRSGSMSLKGLRHMGSRSFGRKEKERPPALPLGAAASNGRTRTGSTPAHNANGNTGKEAVGLFSGQVSPGRSMFPSLRSASGSHIVTADKDTIKSTETRRSEASGVSGAGEFGRISQDAGSALGPPSAQALGSGKENGFSRLFGFGNRKSTETARIEGTLSAPTGSGGTSGTGNGNGNNNSNEKRMPGAKMLAGLGLGHVRGRSGDLIPRLGSSNSNNNPHPGATRSISGPVSVTMHSTGLNSGGMDLPPRPSAEIDFAPDGSGNGSGIGSKFVGMRGSPSYNSFKQAQQVQQSGRDGSMDMSRGPGVGASGWDGLAELHRATTGASAATVTAAAGTGSHVGAATAVPASPASPRSVRRKPVPGHA